MSPLPELIDYYCVIVHSFFQVVTDFFIEVFFFIIQCLTLMLCNIDRLQFHFDA